MSTYRDQPRAYSADLSALLPGAKFYFYASGTTDPKDTYADINVIAPLSLDDDPTISYGTPHPHPLIADSAARLPPTYLSGAYRLIVTDADGIEIHDIDPFSSPYVLPGPAAITAIANDGSALPFATLTIYRSNTTELADLAGDNPITADANGEFSAIELPDGVFRAVMQDADGVLIYDIDPCTSGFVMGEEEMPAIARASFDQFGNLLTGTGISVNATHNSTGNWTVTFDASFFSADPVVAVQCVGSLNANGSTNVNAASASSANILTFNNAGSAADMQFNVIAVAI